MAAANKELVKKCIQDIWIDHHPSGFVKYFTKDYIQHNPFGTDGTSSLEGFFGGINSFFMKLFFLNKINYEPGVMIGEGDFVVAHGRFYGFGPKPKIALDMLKLKDGKIVEHWYDTGYISL